MSLLQYAPAVGVGLGALTVFLILWINWGRPWRRNLRMRQPFAAYFGESERDKWTNELRVAADTEVNIQLRIEPRLHYTQHEIIFGFDGLAGSRPEPMQTSNAFIKVGKAKYTDPRDDPTHYIDAKDAYHIQSRQERTAGNTYALGFTVKTHGPGCFPVRLLVISDSGESRPRKPLLLVVEGEAERQ